MNYNLLHKYFQKLKNETLIKKLAEQFYENNLMKKSVYVLKKQVKIKSLVVYWEY